jgi:hypothetical protein
VFWELANLRTNNYGLYQIALFTKLHLPEM